MFCWPTDGRVPPFARVDQKHVSVCMSVLSVCVFVCLSSSLYPQDCTVHTTAQGEMVQSIARLLQHPDADGCNEPSQPDTFSFQENSHQSCEPLTALQGLGSAQQTNTLVDEREERSLREHYIPCCCLVRGSVGQDASKVSVDDVN